MARAFSEEEKTEIKKKIMETALDLFHDKGTKSLSIKELTRRVGIAQGSFYNFWKDKESLVMELICYRSVQKLRIIEQDFYLSLKHPIEFLTDIIYEYSMDLLVKIENKQIYNDAFKIFYKKNDDDFNHITALYGEFLEKLIDYWESNQVIKEADKDGLLTAIIGSFILCLNADKFNRMYFKDVLRIYIHNIVSQYITL